MRSKAALVGMFVGLVPVMAFGHTIEIPAWRGSPDSTWQEWAFDTDANPAAPDAIDNDFGAASATMAIGGFGTGWISALPGMGSPTGYWDLGRAGTMTLDIDNTTVAADYREIWVQATYFRDINQAPVIGISDAQCIDSETTQLEGVSTGGQWVIEKSIWQLTALSGHDQILLTADAEWGSVIEHIVVDTIAVPEPSSILGLLIGGAVLFVRKSRWPAVKCAAGS